MKTSKLGVQEMSHREMKKRNGGEYFKPAINGSMLANQRAALLRASMSYTPNNPKQTSFWDFLGLGSIFSAPSA